MLKQLKNGIVHGIWIMLVVWIMWSVYAFTSPLPTVNNWDTLTHTAWNDMVDAVNDDYNLTETLTNKTFLWDPVFRKVINVWTTTSNIWKTVAHNITNINRVISVWYSQKRIDWLHLNESASYDNWSHGRRVSMDGTNLYVLLNVDSSGDVYAIIEYTKN